MAPFVTGHNTQVCHAHGTFVGARCTRAPSKGNPRSASPLAHNVQRLALSIDTARRASHPRECRELQSAQTRANNRVQRHRQRRTGIPAADQHVTNAYKQRAPQGTRTQRTSIAQLVHRNVASVAEDDRILRDNTTRMCSRACSCSRHARSKQCTCFSESPSKHTQQMAESAFDQQQRVRHRSMCCDLHATSHGAPSSSSDDEAPSSVTAVSSSTLPVRSTNAAPTCAHQPSYALPTCNTHASPGTSKHCSLRDGARHVRLGVAARR